MNELLPEIYEDIAQPIAKQERVCLLNFTDFGKSFANICISDKCKKFLNDLVVE